MKTIDSVEAIMVELINTVNSDGISGASAAALFPPTGGLMFMFYFSEHATDQEVADLMEQECTRTTKKVWGKQEMLEVAEPEVKDADGEVVPPKTPRFMN